MNRNKNNCEYYEYLRKKAREFEIITKMKWLKADYNNKRNQFKTHKK